MAVALSQLSSFYSYRYFVPPFGALPLPTGATEQQVRAKIAAGDAAYAARKYTGALNSYLEAYALCHSVLHVDFPVLVAIGNPRALQAIDLFTPLVSAAVQTARFREKARSLPIVPLGDPPPRLMKLVEVLSVGTKPPRSKAQLAYHAATTYLQIGALPEARSWLEQAEHANQDDPVLRAHVLTAQAAIQVVGNDVEGAQATMKRAQSQYRELRMRVAEAAVSNNSGVMFSLAGNAQRAGAAFQAAGDCLPETMGRSLLQNLNPGLASSMTRPMGTAGLEMLVPGPADEWIRVPATPDPASVGAQEMRLLIGDRAHTLSLVGNAEQRLLDELYTPRVVAEDLRVLHPHLELDFNLVAYLPHVYGFVLPMDIGDCYLALGRRSEAVTFYLKALDNQFLNHQIEAPQVWLRAARAIVEEADYRFRRGDSATAKDWYERVLRTDGTAPTTSQLYQHQRFVPMVAIVQRAVAAMDGGPLYVDNFEVASLIAYVRAQLAKITAGLNWLGLADDVVPIWSFDFLQGVARYFAQHAIQAWREYISYRAAAEQAEMTERELEQAVTMNVYALEAQLAQQELADRQLAVTEALQQGAILHRDNLTDSRDQFNTDGWVVAELNRFQAWYGNANANTKYGDVRWDWGGGRELSVDAGSAQKRVDAVVDYRNRLSHQMQIDNFNRQIAEANSQIAVANRQLDVAHAQQTVARWQTWGAERRLDFAQENLTFFQDREFTPDLWHALAERLRDVANRYLEMGIYAAFLMERAYAVENDRDLHRIRFDYAVPGGVTELTAGDSLLLDIDSFTHDLLAHVKGRRNRVRHVISLADFAPAAFTDFLQTGVMAFTIPLWVLERVYPGTYLHRIQSVEVEIEGLQVPEGITGTLTHLGISEWRREDGTTRSRVTAPESMVLSGFRLRRDLVVYRADPNRLGLFENSGTAASWRLELPAGTNDVDFTTISDVRLVLYFYCLHDEDLEASIRAAFPASSEAAQSFSARLHAPDQFFALGPPPDGSSTMTFSLDAAVFPYNQRNLRVTEVGVQVLRASASGMAEPFPAVPLTVRMGGLSGAGATDANGVIASAGATGPLAGLVGQPVGDVAIEFTGSPTQLSDVTDVFLLLNYVFDYR